MPNGELIEGLAYVRSYLDLQEQHALLATVDSQPWRADLRRRVQHYGYRYDYTRKRVDADLFLGPLPSWAALLAQRLHDDGYSDDVPDQVIVNEYLPGQGISAHIDCAPCFAESVLSLSLGSTCVMRLSRSDAEPVEVFLEPGSLLVMRGDARYEWRHEIAARRSDRWNGQTIARERRVSLTFRTVLL